MRILREACVTQAYLIGNFGLISAFFIKYLNGSNDLRTNAGNKKPPRKDTTQVNSIVGSCQ